MHPGNCWAFQGPQGFAVIRLSARIHPTAVTLEHVPKSLSPNSTISSAPKDFAVFVSTPPVQGPRAARGPLGSLLRIKLGSFCGWGRGADLEEMVPGWEMALRSQLSQATEEETEVQGAK